MAEPPQVPSAGDEEPFAVPVPIDVPVPTDVPVAVAVATDDEVARLVLVEVATLVLVDVETEVAVEDAKEVVGVTVTRQKEVNVLPG
jgi:hypothetical protein